MDVQRICSVCRKEVWTGFCQEHIHARLLITTPGLTHSADTPVETILVCNRCNAAVTLEGCSTHPHARIRELTRPVLPAPEQKETKKSWWDRNFDRIAEQENEMHSRRVYYDAGHE